PEAWEPLGLGKARAQGEGFQDQGRREHRQREAPLEGLVGTVDEVDEPELAAADPVAPDLRYAQGRVDGKTAARTAAVVHLDPEIRRRIDFQVERRLAEDARCVSQVEALIWLFAMTLLDLLAAPPECCRAGALAEDAQLGGQDRDDHAQ